MACKASERIAENYVKQTLEKVKLDHKKFYGRELDLSNNTSFIVPSIEERDFITNLLDKASNSIVTDTEGNPVQIDLYSVSGAGIHISYNLDIISNSIEQSINGARKDIDYTNRNSKAYKNLNQEIIEELFESKKLILDEFIKTATENLTKVVDIKDLKKILREETSNKEVRELYNIKKSLEREQVSGNFNSKVKAFTHYILQAEVLSGQILKAITELDLEGQERFIHIHQLHQLIAGTKESIKALREEFKYLPKEHNPLTYLIANTLDNMNRIEAIKISEAEKFSLDQYSGIHNHNAKKIEKSILENIKKFEDLAKNHNDPLIRTRAAEKVIKLNEDLKQVPNKQKLRDVITGEAGDVNYWGQAIRAAISSGDAVISGFAAKVKETLSKADRILNEIKNDFETNIEELKQNTNINFGLPEIAFNDMLSHDEEYDYIVGEKDLKTFKNDKELTDHLKNKAHKAYYLLNEVSSEFHKDKRLLSSKREYWKELYKSTPKDDPNFKNIYINYIASKKAFRDFATTYLEREYTPEFYEIENLLDQFVDGIYLRDYYSRYDDDIKILKENIALNNGGQPTKEQSNKLGELYKKSYQLKSPYYQEQLRKKAKENSPENSEFIDRYFDTRVKIAKILEEYEAKDNARFTREFKKETIENWLKLKKQNREDLVELGRQLKLNNINQAEFENEKEKLERWYNNNVVSTPTDSWFMRRQDLWLEKDNIAEQISDITGVGKEKISDKYNNRKSIARSYRDKSGVINGQNMLNSEIKTIKKIDEELQEEIGYFDKIMNYPPKYYDLIKRRKELNIEKLAVMKEANLNNESYDIKELVEEIKEITGEINTIKEEYFTNNPRLKELHDEFQKVNKQNFEMQNTTVTEYYSEEKKKQFSLFLEEKSKEDLPLSFTRNDIEYTYKNGNYYMNSETKVDELYTGTLEGLNILLYQNEFENSNWWKNNHVFKEKYNEETNSFEQYWDPIYAWKHTIPSDSKDFLREAPANHWKTKSTKTNLVNKNFESSKLITGEPGLKKEFYKKPGSKYYSKDYHALSEPKKKFLDWITNEYIKSQENYPLQKRNGYKIPAIDKEIGIDSFDTADRGKLLTTLGKQVKREVFSTEQDLDSGDPTAGDLASVERTELGSTEGRIVKHRPIYYSNRIDDQAVSKNIFDTILRYVDASNRYKLIGEKVTPLYEATKITLEANVPKSDAIDAVSKSLARKIQRKTGETLGIRRLTDQKQTNNRLKVIDELYDMFGNGVMNVKPPGKSWLEKKTGINPYKLNSTLLNLKSAFVLSANPLSGHAYGTQIGNAGNAMIQQLISTHVNNGDTNFTISQWFDAYKYMTTTGVMDLSKDWWEGRTGNKSEFGQMLDKFGVFEGEVKNRAGKSLQDKNTIRRLFSTDLLFVVRNSVEITIGATTYKAFSDNYMVEWQENKIPISEAYEMIDGIMTLKKGVKFPEATEQEYQDYLKALENNDIETINNYIDKGEFIFKNKIQNLLRQINGTYATYDKVLLQRYWWGANIMWMRNWAESLLRNRYGSKEYSYERGEYVEGYWRTSAKILLENLTSLIFNREKHDPRLWNLFRRNLDDIEYLESYEKDALMKLRTEALMIATVLVVISTIFGYNEEDDERFKKMKKNGDLYWYSWLNNWGTYGFLKMESELKSTAFPFAINELQKIYENPFQQILPFLMDLKDIGFNDINYTSWLKETTGVIDNSDPFFSVYEQNSGPNEKGDIKAVNKLIGVLGFSTSKRDESGVEAIKNLERARNR